MGYFWKQQDDIPEGMGYPLFGVAHIISVLIMPASIMALLFADWTVYYPVWNFINLHSYLWHGLLILYPLLLKLRGDISTSVKHIHWVLIFLILVVPPIYIFDSFKRGLTLPKLTFCQKR